MTLAGGDSRGLTLGGFLDAALAALVEEYQRQGMDLMTALDETRDWASANLKVPAAERPNKFEASMNDRALQQLERMMQGTVSA